MDWITRLTRKMMARAQKGMAQGMQEVMREALGELARGALDPAKLAEMMKSMGIDASQLSGMMGQQQPGFDAYAVLGLSKGCSDEELRLHYRRIMAKIHPDRGGQEMTFIASLVNTAYQMIRKERGIP